jgi:hypothetical protein
LVPPAWVEVSLHGLHARTWAKALDVELQLHQRVHEIRRAAASAKVREGVGRGEAEEGETGGLAVEVGGARRQLVDGEGGAGSEVDAMLLRGSAAAAAYGGGRVASPSRGQKGLRPL